MRETEGMHSCRESALGMGDDILRMTITGSNEKLVGIVLVVERDRPSVF